jgi:signal transduction histidine kinase
VADTGAGIAQSDIERVFDPFWQADPSHTRHAQGSGLGLTVARRFAQLLGGEVTVQSQLQQGSTLTVRIPLQAN